jgi:hypothetical protein
MFFEPLLERLINARLPARPAIFECFHHMLGQADADGDFLLRLGRTPAPNELVADV